MDDYDPFRQDESVIARHKGATMASTKQLPSDHGEVKAPNVDTSPVRIQQPESPVSPSSASLKRQSKPRRLVLERSNGSSASSPSFDRTSFAIVTTVTTNARGVASASNVVAPNLEISSSAQALPRTSDVIMGNAESKCATTLGESRNSPIASKLTLRRRANDVAERPTSSATREKHSNTKPLPNLPKSPGTKEHGSNSPAGTVRQLRKQRSAYATRVDSLDPSRDNTLPATAPLPPSKLPPTPPRDIFQSNENVPDVLSRFRGEDSPTLAPPMLPLPPPISEDTPTKYGILPTTQPFDSDDSEALRRHKRKRQGQGRDSSAKAHDMVKITTDLQQQRNFANIISPPISRPTTPVKSVPASPTSIVHPPKSPAEPQVADIVIETDERVHSVWAADSTSRPLSNLARQPLPAELDSSSKSENIAALLTHSRPMKTNAPILSVTQICCLQQHKRWRAHSNEEAPIACAICFTDQNGISNDDGTPQRWSCVWCALRVCLSCRDKVETAMGRDPKKTNTRHAVRKPPWAMQQMPAITSLAPPPPIRYGDSLGSRSATDLRATVRSTSRGKAPRDRGRCLSVGAADEDVVGLINVRGSAMHHGASQLSQVEYVDEGATLTKLKVKKHRTLAVPDVVRRRDRHV